MPYCHFTTLFNMATVPLSIITMQGTFDFWLLYVYPAFSRVISPICKAQVYNVHGNLNMLLNNIKLQKIRSSTNLGVAFASVKQRMTTITESHVEMDIHPMGAVTITHHTPPFWVQPTAHCHYFPTLLASAKFNCLIIWKCWCFTQRICNTQYRGFVSKAQSCT